MKKTLVIAAVIALVLAGVCWAQVVYTTIKIDIERDTTFPIVARIVCDMKGVSYSSLTAAQRKQLVADVAWEALRDRLAAQIAATESGKASASTAEQLAAIAAVPSGQ